MKSWIAALLLPSVAIAAPQLNVARRYYGNDTQAEVYSVKFPTGSGAAPTAWGSTGYTAQASPTGTAASSSLSPYPHGTGVPDRHHRSYSSSHPAHPAETTAVTHSSGSIYTAYTTYDPVYPASASTSTSTSTSSSISTQEPATWTTYTKSHPTATSTSTAAGYCAHPGTYECTYSHADGAWGWAVCDVSYNWVHAGLCGTGQTCTMNAENASPYCM